MKDSHTVSMKINLPGFIVLSEDHTFDEIHCLIIKSLTLHSPSYSMKRKTFSFPNVILMPCWGRKMLFRPFLLFMGILPILSLPLLSYSIAIIKQPPTKENRAKTLP